MVIKWLMMVNRNLVGGISRMILNGFDVSDTLPSGNLSTRSNGN
jgi:hypothetical protein